jgi:hypothetical protein
MRGAKAKLCLFASHLAAISTISPILSCNKGDATIWLAQRVFAQEKSFPDKNKNAFKIFENIT